MIVGIEGIIEKKEPTFIHLNVNGIIYKIIVSIHTSGKLTNKRVKLLISQIIREDTNLLYGFLDESEKKMFDTLLKINGIGAKVAMATCSTFTPSQFSQIISNKEINLLKKVVGIGVKSANRILIELSDFTIENNHIDSNIGDAILALESLGFKKEHIQKALIGATGDTADIVKYGLKKLQKY
jgi:Holliday junction DNA helicase RuvA